RLRCASCDLASRGVQHLHAGQGRFRLLGEDQQDIARSTRERRPVLRRGAFEERMGLAAGMQSEDRRRYDDQAPGRPAPALGDAGATRGAGIGSPPDVLYSGGPITVEEGIHYHKHVDQHSSARGGYTMRAKECRPARSIVMGLLGAVVAGLLSLTAGP